MALGEKLTQARKAAGLTQADVAAKLNVSRQAVSRWESGQSKPSTERLLALGELYGVSIDQLLNTGNVEAPAVEIVSAPPEVEVTGSGHSGTAVHTSMAEICGCCALRRTVDAGDPAYAETT